MVGILFITLNGVRVYCITESYSFLVSENGATFTEDVEVDVDNQTEVIRVPQHNDADAMEMMNDFGEGLSVYRVPSARACYVSKLDSSLPEPGKMRVNMEQASMLPSLPRQVTTKERAWRVEGFANRSSLPQTFLDFCGSFPIYTIVQIPMDFTMSSLRRGHGREKRCKSFEFRSFAACGPEGVKEMGRCLMKLLERQRLRNGSGRYPNYKLECKFDLLFSYYVVDCLSSSQSGKFQCKGLDQMSNFLGFCCDMKC